MWFRLAQKLGMSVARCMLEVSSLEFTYWCELYAIEPWGSRVEDLHAGLIAATVANSTRGPKTDPYKPKDFLPWWTDIKPRTVGQPSPEAVAASVFGLNLAELKRSGKQKVIQRRKSGRFVQRDKPA